MNNDITLNLIQKSLNEHIVFNTKEILENGVQFNNEEKLKNSITSFIKDIHDNKIPDFYTSRPTTKTVLQILDLLPISLVDVNPIDFEGEDALTKEELLLTSAIYIKESLINNEIIGICSK